MSSRDERILSLNWSLAEQDQVQQSTKGAFGLEQRRETAQKAHKHMAQKAINKVAAAKGWGNAAGKIIAAEMQETARRKANDTASH